MKSVRILTFEESICGFFVYSRHFYVFPMLLDFGYNRDTKSRRRKPYDFDK